MRVLAPGEWSAADLRPEEHSFVWVDVAEPSDEDVAWLRDTFGFHPLALEDVARRHQRAKIDEYEGYYFVVLYGARVLEGVPPARTPTDRITTDELQFFWGPDFLVTVHAHGAFPEVDDLIGRLRRGTLGPLPIHGGRHYLRVADVVYRLIDAVVDGYFPVVDSVAEWSEELEERMFARSRGRGTLQAIFGMKKDLFHLRKAIAPSRDVVNVFLRRDHPLFDDGYLPYFQDIYDHTVRVLDSLDTYRDLLTSALDTYLSVVSNDLNQTMRTMTAVTAILMVDALIAGIYGMNFDVMPELHWTLGYAWALGLMAAASMAMWVLFKRIRWL